MELVSRLAKEINKQAIEIDILKGMIIEQSRILNNNYGMSFTIKGNNNTVSQVVLGSNCSVENNGTQ